MYRRLTVGSSATRAAGGVVHSATVDDILQPGATIDPAKRYAGSTAALLRSIGRITFGRTKASGRLRRRRLR
ncbi:MAG: hypothetical protein EA398_12540 [Deltaproteobacteria bacterium]|nr:MAG: hypothetical protein EA398_12540 [Deltaproteobacteria bacterium]